MATIPTLEEESDEEIDYWALDNVSSHDEIEPLTGPSLDFGGDKATSTSYLETLDGIDVMFPPKSLKIVIARTHRFLEKNLGLEDEHLRHMTAAHEAIEGGINCNSYKTYAAELITSIEALRERSNSPDLHELDQLTASLMALSLANEAMHAVSHAEPDYPINDDEDMDPYDQHAVTQALEPFVDPLTECKEGPLLLVGIVIHIMDDIVGFQVAEGKRCFQWLDRSALIALRADYARNGKKFREGYLPIMDGLQKQLGRRDILGNEYMWNSRKFLKRAHSFDVANMLASKVVVATKLPQELVLVVRDAMCSFDRVIAASRWRFRSCPWRSSTSCECSDCDAFNDMTPGPSDWELFEKATEQLGGDAAMTKMPGLGCKVNGMLMSGLHFHNGDLQECTDDKKIAQAEKAYENYNKKLEKHFKER